MGAEQRLASEFQRDMPWRPSLRPLESFTSISVRKYRERIVGAGFHLQRRVRRADASAGPLRMHQQKTAAAASVDAKPAPTSKRFGPVQIERNNAGDPAR